MASVTSPAQRLVQDLTVLHRQTAPGDLVRLYLPPPTDLARPVLDVVVHGAGFRCKRRMSDRPSVLHRLWSLPDTVDEAMTLLICGLNPSPAAADAGVGFARPGNRFWPSALAAGVASVGRDPDHALRHHGMGMTDIVKRTTRRADELSAEEYAAGLGRVGRLVERCRPRAVCFVGLAGWRTVVDRKAHAGWQPDHLGGRPVYLMPSTSGLNANAQLPELTQHLRQAAAGPSAGNGP